MDEDSSRPRIAELAQHIAEGRLDFLEGVRLIASLRAGLSQPDMADPDLLILMGVESELERIPTGAARAQWDPSYLAALDTEKHRYYESCSEDILRACRALTAKWNG